MVGLSMPFLYIYIVHIAVLQPRTARRSVWPLPLSLATTYGITTCFLFLLLLRCFSSEGLRLCLYIFNVAGCPIRTSTDQKSFAPPRCLTQLITSFVASGSQGIPHTLLFTSCSSSISPFAIIQLINFFHVRKHSQKNSPLSIRLASTHYSPQIILRQRSILYYQNLQNLTYITTLNLYYSFPVLSMNSSYNDE
jgi:hypothetical protein